MSIAIHKFRDRESETFDDQRKCFVRYVNVPLFRGASGSVIKTMASDLKRHNEGRWYSGKRGVSMWDNKVRVTHGT